MNQYTETIIKNSVQLLVRGLNFVPGLEEEDFYAALDQASEELQDAKDLFVQARTEDNLTIAEQMGENALEIIHASCDAAGETKLDNYFEMGEAILKNVESNNGHFIAAAIKAGLQKLFGKKSSSASTTVQPTEASDTTA